MASLEKLSRKAKKKYLKLLHALVSGLREKATKIEIDLIALEMRISEKRRRRGEYL